MAFTNPNDSSEILYGASGDVRNEINAGAAQTTPGHYVGEQEIPGSLIIGALEESTREINIYLEPVYPDQIPFTAAGDVPRFLEKISKNMATYFVWRAAYVILGNLPDEKKANYYDVYTDPKTGLLIRIANGDLTISELESQTPLETKSSIATGRTPIFDVDSDFQQAPDPNLLDDIQRERDT